MPYIRTAGMKQDGKIQVFNSEQKKYEAINKRKEYWQKTSVNSGGMGMPFLKRVLKRGSRTFCVFQ